MNSTKRLHIMPRYLVTECDGDMKENDGAIARIIYQEDITPTVESLHDDEYWNNSKEGLDEDESADNDYIFQETVQELFNTLL